MQTKIRRLGKLHSRAYFHMKEDCGVWRLRVVVISLIASCRDIRGVVLQALPNGLGRWTILAQSIRAQIEQLHDAVVIVAELKGHWQWWASTVGRVKIVQREV